MTDSRRQKVEAMLADEPHDTFLRYTLAMEWDKEGEHDKSLQLYNDLMAGEPPYVPAYFMAGQMLARLDRIADARAILRDGIEHARQQNNTHAAGEMSEFLASLGNL